MDPGRWALWSAVGVSRPNSVIVARDDVGQRKMWVILRSLILRWDRPRTILPNGGGAPS